MRAALRIARTCQSRIGDDRMVMTRIALGIAVLATMVGTARAQPSYDEPSARDVVVAYNTGLRVSIMPGIILSDGDVGFSIAGDLRYGFEVGPFVMAPGLRLSGFFPPGFVVLTAIANLRLTLPLGPVGPYILGGVGPGYVTEPSQAGLAYQAGGGLMIHIGRSFALGAEAVYFGITGTEFRTLFIGPALLLGF